MVGRKKTDIKHIIFVTGGAGYIGSHVAKELRRKGYRPLVYDNLSTGHQWAVSKDELIEGDLGNKEYLQAILHKEKPLAVMHFAADSIVNES
jgi:UDP-glucose 4-epimerase